MCIYCEPVFEEQFKNVSDNDFEALYRLQLRINYARCLFPDLQTIMFR